MSKTLADLTVGDKVAIMRGPNVVAICDIHSITQTGRFNLWATQFMPNGRQVGNRDCCIQPATEEHWRVMEHTRTLQRAQQITRYLTSEHALERMHELSDVDTKALAEALEQAMSIVEKTT